MAGSVSSLATSSARQEVLIAWEAEAKDSKASTSLTQRIKARKEASQMGGIYSSWEVTAPCDKFFVLLRNGGIG